ncbi:MAG: recombinase family protein [Streptosporangiaceae bacterium]
MDHGYARVSTRKAKGRKQQHVDNQVDRLVAHGVDRDAIYVDDGVSGRKASRPEWDKLWDQLRPGDKIVATRMTRIGRSLENLLTIVSECDRRGIDIEFLDEDLDTSTSTGRLIFRIMASISEYQAELIAENVREGLERARERHGGTLPVRGPSFTDKQRENAEELARKTTFSAGRIAEMVGVSRATLYRHVDIVKIRENVEAAR